MNNLLLRYIQSSAASSSSYRTVLSSQPASSLPQVPSTHSTTQISEASITLQTQTASALSACQSLAGALTASWSTVKAASATCLRMCLWATTGKLVRTESPPLHQISSDTQLLPSRDRKRPEQQHVSDAHELLALDVSGPEPKAASTEAQSADTLLESSEL